MFKLSAKPAPRMVPMLRRVLIVDPQEASARALSDLLGPAGRPDIWVAPSQAKALKLAAKVDPELIFCEFAADKLDGTAFTRALRRGELACRQAPVILTAPCPTATATLAGRDAGAHEFLARPFTSKELMRRLEAVTSGPRGWVEAVDYVGPDRRQFNSAAYDGPLKRMADQAAPPHTVRISEAVKIIRSALAAIDREPVQAMRALLAQTAIIEASAAETGDARVTAANHQLQGWLLAAAGQGPLDAAEAARQAQALVNQVAREARAA